MAKGCAFAFAVVWSAAAILAMAWGTVYNWPDYVHVAYGYPLTWATHTLNTIAGPVDKWRTDLVGLAFDSLFWLGFLAAGAYALLWRRGPARSSPDSRPTSQTGT